MCKRCQIYLYGLKKTCLGVLERGDRDKDIETGSKEGGVIEMSIYKCFPLRDARSLRFKYLPAILPRRMAEASSSTPSFVPSA